MKIFITGPGRHGKDTVSQLFCDNLGLRFSSSSMFVAERAVRPHLEEHHGLVYSTLKECYDDRVNHRTKWRYAIAEYCKHDLQRVAKEIFALHDIYCGIRRREEFLASRHMADLSIYVDASERVLGPDLSLDIKPKDCTFTLDNNGTQSELVKKVSDLCWLLR